MASPSYVHWQKRAWIEPSAPKPVTPRPVTPVVRRPPPSPTVAPKPTTVVALESKRMSPLESIMKHPIAPVIGGVLVAASYLTDEPTPPTLPAGMPDATAKQWSMVYNQNQQRFQRRMDLYKDVGMVLLGYAGAQTLMDALPKHDVIAALAGGDADTHAAALAGHRKL